ncbi:hypothetical protein JMJ77_0015244, partial [Colletotrichum scovillei]
MDRTRLPFNRASPPRRPNMGGAAAGGGPNWLGGVGGTPGLGSPPGL